MPNKRNLEPTSAEVINVALEEVQIESQDPDELELFFVRNHIYPKVRASLKGFSHKKLFACDGNFLFRKGKEELEGIIIARKLTSEEARDIIERVTGSRPVTYCYLSDNPEDDNPYGTDEFGKSPQSYYCSEMKWGYTTISGRCLAYEDGNLIAEGLWWFQSEKFRFEVRNAIMAVESLRKVKI